MKLEQVFNTPKIREEKELNNKTYFSNSLFNRFSIKQPKTRRKIRKRKI